MSNNKTIKNLRRIISVKDKNYNDLQAAYIDLSIMLKEARSSALDAHRETTKVMNSYNTHLDDYLVLQSKYTTSVINNTDSIADHNKTLTDYNSLLTEHLEIKAGLMFEDSKITERIKKRGYEWVSDASKNEEVKEETVEVPNLKEIKEETKSWWRRLLNWINNVENMEEIVDKNKITKPKFGLMGSVYISDPKRIDGELTNTKDVGVDIEDEDDRSVSEVIHDECLFHGRNMKKLYPETIKAVNIKFDEGKDDEKI